MFSIRNQANLLFVKFAKYHINGTSSHGLVTENIKQPFKGLMLTWSRSRQKVKAFWQFIEYWIKPIYGSSNVWNITCISAAVTVPYPKTTSILSNLPCPIRLKEHDSSSALKTSNAVKVTVGTNLPISFQYQQNFEVHYDNLMVRLSCSERKLSWHQIEIGKICPIMPFMPWRVVSKALP